MALSPSVLGERDTELLAAERALADRLDACLRGFESSTEDAETLRRVTETGCSAPQAAGFHPKR